MTMGLIRERAQFDFMPLSERPDAIPQVARWWCDEWGLPQGHESMESYLGELASLKPCKLPIHLLALSERNIVGVATLKDQSALHKLFPDFQYWLSGVYVPQALRSRGIATALCLKMVLLSDGALLWKGTWRASRRQTRAGLWMKLAQLGLGLIQKTGFIYFFNRKFNKRNYLILSSHFFTIYPLPCFFYQILPSWICCFCPLGSNFFRTRSAPNDCMQN